MSTESPSMRGHTITTMTRHRVSTWGAALAGRATGPPLALALAGIASAQAPRTSAIARRPLRLCGGRGERLGHGTPTSRTYQRRPVGPALASPTRAPGPVRL